jgi:diguanylate cyclase (GGDEF)-like protein
LYLDIDHFKQINDRLGHDIGDLFLISFAKRLKRYVREIDTFARLGGDEFAILLPLIDSEEGAEIVAKRMLQAAESGWDIAGNRFDATLSIGISIYPIHGADEETLFRHVDETMYKVKRGGRNGYKFYC